MIKTVQAYPLEWPQGWKRSREQKHSTFKTSNDKARKFLFEELSRLGATSIVLSTNMPLRMDGMPRGGAGEPRDAGTAVYFQLKGKPMVFACDQYRYLRENLQALGKTIEALRGIERWGASDMMERAFTGFKQLNAENLGRSWWEELNLTPHAQLVEIEAAYKRRARECHPDMPGGSHEAMARLNEIYVQACAAAGGAGL